MKRHLLLISAVLLSVIAGVQTAMAQKVTLYSAGSKAYECDVTQLDSIVFSEGQTIPTEEIVVTVDINGNADGGHKFTRIDDTSFLIDELKYGYSNGSLSVIGYDQVFFSGVAKPISRLIYNSRIMNVVGIGYRAFSGCSSLTSITIPESMISIEDQAFFNCTGLTSVTIPNSVTSIGNSAFYNCTSLTSVTIPNSVTSIGGRAFSDCTSLTSVTIPGSVTSIGDKAFYSCSSLPSITIPESVTIIGQYAFYSCTGLTSITIPNSVTSIDYGAFSYCSNLTSITIGSSVTSIGREAFNGCTGLISVILESNTIVSASRLGTTSMKSIFGNQVKEYVIGNSVTSIGGSAFSGCSSLTSIIIPNSVTSIDYGAFYDCSSLTDVYCYAENVPSTSSDAFYESTISSATLHVPAGSVNAYKASEPWKNFGAIVAIE